MIRSMLRFLFVLAALAAATAAAKAVLRRALPSIGDETSDEVRLVAIGEACSLSSRSTAWRGGSSVTALGAARIDLRQAKVDPGGAILRL